MEIELDGLRDSERAWYEQSGVSELVYVISTAAEDARYNPKMSLRRSRS